MKYQYNIIFYILCLMFYSSLSFAKESNLIQLLQNPDQLKKEMQDCGFLNGKPKKSSLSSDHCQLVENAAIQFSNLVNEQRDNAEKFGEKIMQLENACSKNPNHTACEEVKKYLAVLSLATPS